MRRDPRTPENVSASAAGGTGDFAAVDLSAPLATCRKAAATRAVPPDEVIAALVHLDAAHSASSLVQRGSFPGGLAGTWRLVFAYPAPIKSWSYIPVIEDAVIDPSKGECASSGNNCRLCHARRQAA